MNIHLWNLPAYNAVQLAFQALLSLILAERVKDYQDKRIWSLEANNVFLVKCLVFLKRKQSLSLI